MQVFKPSSHPAEAENCTVLVLRDSTGEKKSDGGIFLADQSVEIANQGEVRAVSTVSSYVTGDRVVFTKYAGSTIELNGVEYVLLKEKEIQGTVESIGDPTKSLDQQKDDLKAALAKFEEQAGLIALASTATDTTQK
jgi:chaperonin GroES